MKIREITRDQWSAAIREVELASFFEYPEWYSIWEQYFNTRSYAYLIDDHLLISVIELPGAKGKIRFYNSSPAGTYSNLRSVKGHTVLDNKGLKIIRDLTSINFFRLNPFTNVTIKNSSAVSEEVTHLIQVDDDEITRSWSRNHKRLLKTAQQSDITISLAESDKDWGDYYSIYKQSFLKRAGVQTNRYSSKLFDYIRDLSTSQMKLWLAKKDDQVIAGRLVFYTHDYAVEWHAASRAEAEALGANHQIIYEILKNARANGIQVYDFNPSAGLKGVEEFKAKFGAVKRNTPVYKSYDFTQSLYLQYIKWRK